MMMYPVLKRDGRYVIASRQNNLEKKGEGDGLVHIGLSLPTMKQKLREEIISEMLELQKGKKKKKDKKHKKSDKKKAKYKLLKNKKKKKAMYGEVTENLNGQKIKFSNLMAELIKYSDNLLVADNLLYIYDKTVGCYKVCIQKEVAKKLRTLLEEDDRLKVTSRQYKEAYEQLLIAEEVQHDVEFFANEPYVNCLNGVYDVREGVLKKHSAKYYFKHVLNAEFEANAECPMFMDYIETITRGDKELKKLIQVVMGYILSHYNNSKIAVLLYGVPHTGKSVLCKIITDIIGEEFVSNIDLAFLEKQEYAAALNGMLVNIAPDLKNEPLKDPGFFKSLVSHNDTVNARLLYHNTGKVKGETKMIFCSNHLVEIGANVSSMDAEAVFNRLLYIPFQNNTISEEDDNKNVARDIIRSERNGVFRWAMEGLKEYIDSGETFPKCKLSEEVKAMNMAHYCPEQVFWKMCVKKDEEAYVSTKKVKEAFERFCADREVKGRYNIGDYIKNIEKIPTERKRIDDEGNLVSIGNPVAVYKGLRIRKKYL